MRILERGDQQQTTRGVIAGAAVVGQCHKSSAVKNQMTKLLPGWEGKRSGRDRETEREVGCLARSLSKICYT